MGKPADYHLLPIAEKRKLAFAQIREPAVTCPQCDMQVMPADLLAHMKERCDGQREPGAGAKWVTFREVISLGVPRATLVRWVDHGFVRARGEPGDRQYLHRDLALKISQRLRFSRR